MAEEFDIGPLTWVKDEIDQALTSVLGNLETYQARPDDSSVLRFSQPYVYQVSGALDMVGLQACKRFCSEMEKVLAGLEQGTIPAATAAIDLLAQAIHTLQRYLQSLLDGAPNRPVSLFPELRALAESRGTSVSETELFFPDVSIRAPRDLPERVLAEDEMPSYVAKQRIIFQKSLVQWLSKADPDSLQTMREALEQVRQVQQQAAQKRFWWLAGVFLEALEQPQIAELPDVRRLYRQIDQQLRDLARGGNKITSKLLRELLFHIARSTPSTPAIRQVKALFELDELLPSAAAEAPAIQSDIDATLLDSVRGQIAGLRESWSTIAEGANEELTAFDQKIGVALTAASQLEEQALLGLLESIQALARVVPAASARDTGNLLVEIAASLNLLQDILVDHTTLEPRAVSQLQAQTQRLQRALSGDITVLQADPVKLDESTLLAIAKQVAAALQQVEETLDGFFRNPADRSVLQTVAAPLKQVVAAFDMLEIPVPASVAAAAARLVAYFHTGALLPGERRQAQFELVAESLSMLGFFVEEFPRIRPESLGALEETLEKLAAEQDFIDSETAHQVPAETAEEVGAPAAVPKQSLPDPELLEIFITEAEEVLAGVAQQLQTLRVNDTDHAALVEVRRGYHTLKGSGRTVGLEEMGAVAWAVEKLLNFVLENDRVPDSAQLTFVEKASAAFADWIATLVGGGSCQPEPAAWQAAAELLMRGEASGRPPASEAAQVLIGGTRKISQTLFDIFRREAHQHLANMQLELQKLLADATHWSSRDLSRAAHTLASNASATGFRAISVLARALENWLDEHTGAWEPRMLKLLSNVIVALEEMLAKAEALTEPKRANSLLAALKRATEKARHVRAATEQAAAESASVEESAIVVSSPQDQELVAIFTEEARELVPQVGDELRAWRKAPTDVSHADVLQRALHTLKGSARMAGQVELGDTVHGLEGRIAQILKRKAVDADFDDMFHDVDRIGALLEELTGDQPVGRGAVTSRAPGNRRAQFLRLRADVLDRLINEAGEVSITRSRLEREMQAFKRSSLELTESVLRLRNYLRELEIETESQMQSRMTLLQEAQEAFDPLEFDRFTRLQELTRMMAESVNDVSTIQAGLLGNLDETESALQQQNRMNRELQYGLMAVRMVPFSIVAERLHRIVRQTARELNKSVDLQIEGADVEIDRSVLDKIGAPLEHLLRNAVGHGIEALEQRKAAGKNATGSITLRVRRESDEIIITVQDDGGGIQLDKVHERAVQSGLIPAGQDATEQHLLSMIFEPGFSTATDITQIAGRGVGLDAVRGDITGLGGRIEVVNAARQGTTFAIYLPVTLTVAQVVLVRTGSDLYALPSIMVEQLQKLKAEPLAAAYAAGRVDWAERAYPIYYFSRLLGMEQEPEAQLYSPVLLLRSGSSRAALQVDEIIGNQEVVVKPIGPQLARIPGITGASVMGDGRIILIVNPVQMAGRELIVVSQSKLVPAAQPPAKPVVMVVDDSLTMRKVLGRTLEREGYQVHTARDGLDALQLLQETRPDIMLLDIEMPRMDGFELTRNLRGDAATAGVPIIMISSRTAEKHQQYAKELGVNAFLGKPVQDDDLLTEINIQLGKAGLST